MLRRERNEHQQELAAGDTLRPHSDDTAQATARKIGLIHGMTLCIDAEPDYPSEPKEAE